MEKVELRQHAECSGRSHEEPDPQQADGGRDDDAKPLLRKTEEQPLSSYRSHEDAYRRDGDQTGQGAEAMTPTVHINLRAYDINAFPSYCSRRDEDRWPKIKA